MCAYIYIYNTYLSPCRLGISLSINMYIYIYIHGYLHVYIYMPVYDVYVCVLVCSTLIVYNLCNIPCVARTLPRPPAASKVCATVREQCLDRVLKATCCAARGFLM